MYETPTITARNVLELIASDYEDAVLYMKNGPDNEGGEPEPEVWCGAYVPNDQIVLTKENVIDVLGPVDSADDVEHMLPEYQNDVDQVFDGQYLDVD